MLDKLNRFFGKNEEKIRSALKPDEPDKPRTYSTDLKTWMEEAKSEGVEGETSDSGYEVTAGELNAKFDMETAKQVTEKNTPDHHPRLELVENKPGKPLAPSKETKNPFVEVADQTAEEERKLLVRLDHAEAEITAIRAELAVLKAKKRVEVA